MSISSSQALDDGLESLGEFRWVALFLGFEGGLLVLAAFIQTILSAPVIAGLIGAVVVMSVVAAAVILAIVGVHRYLT